MQQNSKVSYLDRLEFLFIKYYHNWVLKWFCNVNFPSYILFHINEHIHNHGLHCLLCTTKSPWLCTKCIYLKNTETSMTAAQFFPCRKPIWWTIQMLYQLSLFSMPLVCQRNCYFDKLSFISDCVNQLVWTYLHIFL